MRRASSIALGFGLLGLAACSDPAETAAPVNTTLSAEYQPEAPVPVYQEEPVIETPAPSTGLMSNNNPEFSDHVVTGFSGAPAEPIIGPDDYSYRTRIRDAARQPVNFAGNSVITTFGCGTGCLAGYVVNLENGEVQPLGLGGEEQMNLVINARADSNLLIAGWESMGSETSTCFYQRYLWDGSSLQPLGDMISVEAPIGECERG